MKSLRSTLLLWLSAGLSAGIIVAAAILYLQAREEANQLFDYQMKQIAAALPSQFFGVIALGRSGDILSEENIVIQIWDITGLRLYYSHDHVDLPQRAVLGFSNINVGGHSWRAYCVQQGNTVVQIAQPLSIRHAIAAQSAIKTVAPLLLLIPLLGSLVWVAVSRGLSPIRRVAAEVQSRDAAALSPVSDAGLPEEILPLTHALNDLLSRLDHAINTQRTFVADAAHELRTPLTALKLQIQLAERAGNDAERNAAFSDLKQGLDRATRLVQQLLTLARQERADLDRTSQPVDLAALARSAVADFAFTAHTKRIDLGIAHADAAMVNGDADALRIMLNNLIDNAIRYSPEGGRIDVSVHAGENDASITVQDTGPGIPDSDLERVFDRFYRSAGAKTSGSGLGLAIVKRIADIHHAEVKLINTVDGLRVIVTIPHAASSV
jgi:two-component system OmpR family sensor kinase